MKIDYTCINLIHFNNSTDIMQTNELLQLYDQDLRQQVEFPEAQKEITPQVVRFTRQPPGMNFIAYTFANDSELDQVIESEAAYFSIKPQRFTWKVFAHDLDRLPSLKNKLVAHNFKEDEPGDVMLLDLETAPTYLFESTSADIRRITDRSGLQDIILVLNKVWGNDNSWVNNRLGGHLEIPDYLSVYAAYINNQPASIAWTYFPKGHFATLFAGSTLPKFRKHGLYTAILSARLKEIRDRGYSYAIVEAGDMSKPIVMKHGFQQLTTSWDYELVQ